MGVTGNQLDTCGLTVSGQREPEGGTAQAHIGDGSWSWTRPVKTGAEALAFQASGLFHEP